MIDGGSAAAFSIASLGIEIRRRDWIPERGCASRGANAVAPRAKPAMHGSAPPSSQAISAAIAASIAAARSRFEARMLGARPLAS